MKIYPVANSDETELGSCWEPFSSEVLLSSAVETELGSCWEPFSSEVLLSSAVQIVNIRICDTVIFCVVLYGSESWSLTLREDCAPTEFFRAGCRGLYCTEER
jgi:hypothetical protein